MAEQRMDVQIMCMLCPARLTESGLAGDDLSGRLDRRARLKGWHHHERVLHQHADVCPDCFESVGRAWAKHRDAELARTAEYDDGPHNGGEEA